MKLTIAYERGTILDEPESKAKRAMIQGDTEDKYVGLQGGQGNDRDILRNYDTPDGGVEFYLTDTGKLHTISGNVGKPETAGVFEDDPTIYLWSSTTLYAYDPLICSIDSNNFFVCGAQSQTGVFNCGPNPFTGLGQFRNCQDKQIKVVYSDRTVAVTPKPKKWKA